MYEVIMPFKDLVNGGDYKVGDIYPMDGVNPAEARINELAGSHNKAGYPLIRLLKPAEDAPVKTTKRRVYR